MRTFIKLLTIAVFIFCLQPSLSNAQEEDKDQVSIIIEVEGDPEKRAEYFHTYFPYVEVVATYDKLFNGLALKADPENLTKMDTLDFIKAIHPVRKYQATATKTNDDPVMPNGINNTKYTGDGVKVGVIDTGINYNHPDLDVNYVDGYDLVDLDEDPMETQQEQGMPTMHGTHVSGIIGADGETFKGVAPDVELYAYRALGPGGSGTSIQVIAALEQAINDGVDIINLSLGNSVNGPDFPTSVAVNRAVKLGVAVVIANGNAGPANWTVGSPATASKALSVGASTYPEKVPYLYEPLRDKAIPLQPMAGAPAWNLTKDYPIVSIEKEKLYGKIALVQRGKKIPFYEKAKEAQDKGAEAVIIYNNEKGNFAGSVQSEVDPIKIPTASISKKDAEWLINNSQNEKLFLETNYQDVPKTIASFSSRGPVTVNWDIKPDVVAPGANILSTVPDGYAVLQGTSMAAPHVAGALALVKEAHPDWTVDQLVNALKTTANPLYAPNGEILAPIVQGMGVIKPEAAIQTETILHEPLLSFGKVEQHQENKKVTLTVENTSNHAQEYYFTIPNQQQGLRWHLPQEFTVEAHGKKSVPIKLDVTPGVIDKGIHQGYLALNSESETYQLPYLFINETADFQKAMGLEFTLKAFSDDTYMYRLYVTDEVEHVTVDLYNPHTLIHQKTLFEIAEPVVGMNEGFLDEKEVDVTGNYKALVTLELSDGSYESYVTEMIIGE